MRILVNTVPLYGKGPGLRTYTRGLLRALHDSNADMEWHVVLHPADVERLGLAGDCRFRSMSLSSWSVLSQRRGLRFLFRNATDQMFVVGRARHFDVVHYLDTYGPLLPTGHTPLVLSVHDLLPLTHRQYYAAWVQAYLGTLMRLSIPRADTFLAVSPRTAQDLMAMFAISSDRVRVAPNGVDERFRPASPAESQRVRIRYDLPAQYVIYAGSISPRKNVARLVRAFATARRNSELAHSLVLVGGFGWQYHDVLAAIEETNAGGWVRVLGRVPDEDIAPLISSAACLAYPSMEEGFGLPVLEAMGCGTPVLASPHACLEDVLDRAAFVVDAEDEQAIADGLIRLVTDRELQGRLRAAGLEQARAFGWARVAEIVLDVYSELGRRSRC